MKRLKIAALGLSILLLAGCGADTQNRTAEQTKTTTLTLMLPQTHYKPFFVELLQQFEEENPTVHIEAQIIPDNQWLDVVAKKAAVREMPDIVRIDRGVLDKIGTDRFVELGPDEPWYDRVIPAQRENKMIDGKLYGLPIGSSTGLGVVYNRHIFEEYDIPVPGNWEEFQQVCAELRRQGITPLYVSDKDAWTAQLAFDLIAPQIVDASVWQQLKDLKLSWQEVPEFASVLQDMVDLRAAGYTNESSIEATYTSAVEEIAAGRAAMYIAGEYFISDVQQINPDVDLMLFPMPYGKDILTIADGPGQLSISRDSEHIEEAKAFLDWFSQPEHMDKFTAGWGHMPVFEDQQQALTECQQVLADNYFSQGKVVPELSDILAQVDLSTLWQYQQEMYAGILTPEQVLESWNADFAAQVQEKKGQE